jgi:hypothetical protein
MSKKRFATKAHMAIFLMLFIGAAVRQSTG